MAKQRSAALDIYRAQLGGYKYLAAIGENVRGRRLLELIAGDNIPDDYFSLRELGHYTQSMGELDHAERLYDRAREIFVTDTMTIDDLLEEAGDFAALYLKRGLLPRAANPLPLVGGPAELREIIDFLHLGGSFYPLAFKIALYAPGILCAPWKRDVRSSLLHSRPEETTPAAAVVCGHMALPHDLNQARGELTRLRQWSSTSGRVQMVLAAHHLAARTALEAGETAKSLEESGRGVHLADACRFDLLAIDLRLMQARGHLAANDVKAASALAKEALECARDARCEYAWGAADAWHLRALSSHAVDRAGARAAVKEAVSLRKRLRHPGLKESRELLRRLSAP